VSAPMALGPNVEPGHDSAGPLRPPSPVGLRAAVGFLLASLPLGIFWFVMLAVPISLGAFLASFWAAVFAVARALLWWTGQPQRETLVRALALSCAPLTSLAVRGAQSERHRIARSLGYAVPSPYRRSTPGLELARSRAGDPAVWRDLAYLLLLLPVGAAEFALVVAAFVFSLGAITLPAWLPVAFPDGAPLWHDVRIDALPETLTAAVIALPVSVVAAYLGVVGLSRAHAALGRGLLGPSRRARLAERVEELTESRSRAVQAALAERRRIERDLHDGAQQRLVSLAMELGMAKEKMAGDPEAARKLLEEAHGEAKRALAEIRDLVRGIHPAVLSDRGLDAAISALAGRCPVPVVVSVELDGRPSEAVETTAYFVVAEALANVARHSGASEANVAVWRERNPHERLVVEVTDDGKGGADPRSGTGLAGLADRLAALDGRLFVDSPPGGPTYVRAELPLGANDGTTREAP
jgi:signal transduction histidine kinase